MSSPLIRLAGVTKAYPVVSSAGGRLRTLWSLLRRRNPAAAFQALQGISFDVMPGQSLGLVGENGAGKSTLLKIIAGVVRQSGGSVEVNGRIGALLELGAGFHPEYTGRQNIFLSAALMGMSRAEVMDRLDEIIAFADIGEHIDQPIKHYSSGMVVRLGFAVATAMTPQILITDEVLAVGDESFQRKCIAWMENFLAGGGTLLLCSHGMFHIQKLCQKAIWIHHGAMRAFGSAADVTREYMAYHEERSRAAKPEAAVQSPIRGDIYQVRQLQINGIPVEQGGHRMEQGACLTVSGIVYSPDGRVPQVAVGLVRADGTGIYGVTSDMDGFVLHRVGDTEFSFAIRYPQLSFLPGRYLVRGHAMDPEGLRMLDHVETTLDVTGESRELGVCRLAHEWYIP
jgi:lipopolysaccharide transport system ATP-binding protein